MEDLAREINNVPEDRPSKLQLLASGRDLAHPNDSYYNPIYRDVLHVSAPVENGQLVLKVAYFNNINRNGTNWVHLEYAKEDVDGVVGFIDGFLNNEFIGQGVRTEMIETVNTESGDKICRTHLLEKRHYMQSTRFDQIRYAVKSLFGK